MKKENIYKFLYVVSALFVLGFVIRFGADAYKYNIYMGSAPLYVHALVRAAEFIVPGIIVFIVARILKNKYSR